MISETVHPFHGRMFDSDTGDLSLVVLKYRKQYGGCCTGEYVAKQLEEVHVTFLNLHGVARALYIFDNSANHYKIATYALHTKKINLKDGGENTPILRYGFYIDQNRHRVVHTILTAEGFQKGLKKILLECGFWRDGNKKDDALALLLQQDHFYPTKLSSILYDTVKRLGEWIDFVPKYHPELNSIEMYWGYSKREIRTECDYDW